MGACEDRYLPEGEGEWMKPELKNFGEFFGTDPKEVEELLNRVKENVTLKDKRI